LNKINLILKRTFDVFFSALGLIFLLPLFFVISVLIKLDSKGSVLFRQARVGLREKEFKVFKFRTMVVDAEKKGIQLTSGVDSRVTKIGKFLRKSKIDELPQLINVLIGDMSLVGPRPVVPRFVKEYSKEQKRVLDVLPGITDPASIAYINEGELLSGVEDPEDYYIKEIMPKKIELSIEYIEKMTVFSDVRLILKTLFRLIFRKSAKFQKKIQSLSQIKP
jgi:lipopolysaccharide/colanic/teichoic acid biosynthesis glycosyltransferase